MPTIDEKRLMQECFDGERSRDCSWCPAHYTKEGNCCFGHRFEGHDRQCLSCPHKVSCEIATDDLERRQTPHTPPRRIVNTSQTGTRRLVSQSNIRQSGSILSDVPRVPMEMEELEVEGFFHQMGLHALWGGVEGALEMLLGFFRNRRPR